MELKGRQLKTWVYEFALLDKQAAKKSMGQTLVGPNERFGEDLYVFEEIWVLYVADSVEGW